MDRQSFLSSVSSAVSLATIASTSTTVTMGLPAASRAAEVGTGGVGTSEDGGVASFALRRAGCKLLPRVLEERNKS